MDSGPLIEPLPPTRAAASESPYAVLRHRDFSLYLIARFIAALGQQMLTVAVGWELYERTHLSLALGMVGLTQMVPMLLLILPAGHVADNLRPQTDDSGHGFFSRRVVERWTDADFSAARPCALEFTVVFLRPVWRAHSSGRPARRSCPNWCPRGFFPAQ